MPTGMELGLFPEQESMLWKREVSLPLTEIEPIALSQSFIPVPVLTVTNET
jgi:hypothetical protein